MHHKIKRFSMLALSFVLVLAVMFTAAGCGSNEERELENDEEEYYDDWITDDSEDNEDLNDEEDPDTPYDNSTDSDSEETDSTTTGEGEHRNFVPSAVETAPIALSDIADPDNDEQAYTVVNDNTPYFTDEDITTDSYELYSDLDSLGRVQTAMACLGQDLMPTEERGDISSVKPTGWVQNKYSSVSGGYLYNRCHLIAFELAGENANECNLATGTRFLNIDGMLPFENMTADYIKETDNHVMYRITPMFEGDNLLMNGLLMEAYSVEDNGDGIEYCVFCYNQQPGVEIDYKTGDNWEASENAA